LDEFRLSVVARGNDHRSHAITAVIIVTRRKNPRPRWEEGAAAVEAALILPILILAILGIIEFGTAFWQWNTMLLAVEQAGRYVMVNNTSCGVACAETQMQSVLSGASVCTTPAAGQVCVSASTSAGTPSTMTLTAAYSFNLLALFNPFTITSQGTVPLD
jgi:Flp pilus assembly protein TadG